ncbi:hypothetical protein BIY29_19135 [Brenneria alni]|uniref:Right handed beta helix domain-containing protein n=1 Tax=Brenneria alni TaxID=71656 RepID=A0A421DIV4_9GAMM|nr:right-handed parallel beta-helix repeat-containing protein [Brenneria alni]RLM17473.1 hypothetical protein BIY29_19135 [Brenneria alni]
MKRRGLLKFLALSSIPMIFSEKIFAKVPSRNDSSDSSDLLTILERLNKSGNKEINILNIGAHSCTEKNYESFDNRKIIQAVIDYCAKEYKSNGERWNIIIPDGVFLVTATVHKEENGKIMGIHSLLIKSNIIMKGSGTIKLYDHQYGSGAFFRLLSSYRDEAKFLENVDVSGITLDGNAKAQAPGVQASNILIECKNDIKVERIKSINCNGNGIQIRGGSKRGLSARNIYIGECIVHDCQKIGIQVAQFEHLIIQNNDISNCKDNGIDIYGDMGKGSSPEVNGNNFIIRGNKISNCLNGVFPETVSNGEIYGNAIYNMLESGVHINRIHGQPMNISVHDNTINGAAYGFTNTGDMKGIVIKENDLSLIKKSIVSLGGGQGNSSNITIKNNRITLGDTEINLVVLNGVIIRNIDIDENVIYKAEAIENKIHNGALIKNNAKSVNNTVKITGWKLMKK